MAGRCEADSELSVILTPALPPGPEEQVRRAMTPNPASR